MKRVFEFVEGKLSVHSFMELYHADESIQKAIQELMDKTNFNSGCTNCKTVGMQSLIYSGRKHFYDMKKILKEIEDDDGIDSIKGKWKIHLFLSSLVTYHFPHVKPTKKYQDDYDIVTDAIYEYMDGEETERIAVHLYGEMPSGGSKKDKIKQLRMKLKEVFHVEGTKYPRWVQGAEWPMGMHSPMEYQDTRKNGEQRVYVFRDVDTGEIREVEQYY